MENVQSKFSQPKTFMKPNEVLVHIMNVFSFIYISIQFNEKGKYSN